MMRAKRSQDFALLGAHAHDLYNSINEAQRRVLRRRRITVAFNNDSRSLKEHFEIGQETILRLCRSLSNLPLVTCDMVTAWTLELDKLLFDWPKTCGRS